MKFQKLTIMKVRYSYLKQQFSNSKDLWIKLRKFVSTGDFTLGKELKKFEQKFAKLLERSTLLELILVLTQLSSP